MIREADSLKDIRETVAWSPFDSLKDIRETVARSPLGEAASTVWSKRSLAVPAAITCGLAMLVWLSGTGWLIYGLVTRRAVSLLSLALIALPTLVAFAVMAIDQYREFRYLSQVSQLRSEFESYSQRVSAEGLGEITISSGEYDLLSQAETQQMRIEVAEAVKEISQEEEELYSVAMSEEVLDYMKRQPSKARAILYEAVDSLQLDPRPPNAQALAHEENGYKIRSGDYQIIYFVDEGMELVYISRMLGIHNREERDAS